MHTHTHSKCICTATIRWISPCTGDNIGTLFNHWQRHLRQSTAHISTNRVRHAKKARAGKAKQILYFYLSQECVLYVILPSHSIIHSLSFFSSQALPLGMRSVWLFCSCRRITGWKFWSEGGGREASAPKRRTTELKVCLFTYLWWMSICCTIIHSGLGSAFWCILVHVGLPMQTNNLCIFLGPGNICAVFKKRCVCSINMFIFVCCRSGNGEYWRDLCGIDLWIDHCSVCGSDGVCVVHTALCWNRWGIISFHPSKRRLLQPVSTACTVLCLA